MKRSRRERKISKVMGEFKDGTLKSGGSGRKVTNPKQAMAIALSEAEGMNQGGMMYNQIMQRPMFQTPQQRQGMGIMAGVAPVRGYKDGDLADKEDGTEEEGEGLFNETLAKASELGEDAIKYAQENPVEAALMFIPGLGAAGLAVRFGPKIIRGLMKGASKSKAPQQASKQADELQVSLSPGASYNVAGAASPPVAPTAAATATTPRTLRGIMSAAPAATAGAIRRNPGKAALAGIAAGGASTIPFGGGETTDEPPADTSTDDTGGGDDTGDQQSGIMKFLFGADGIGGEPGAVGKTMEYLADPKTRYALARAAESRPGVVDRNFFTDFTLGQAEYEAAQQQNQTAFMRNFEALREIYPDDVTDQEIAQLALGDSDDPRKTFLSLFETKVATAIPPTETDIKNFAAISGFELSDDQIKQLASSAEPVATLP